MVEFMRPHPDQNPRAAGPRPTRGAWKAALALVLLGLLASCAGEFDTPGEALRLVQPTLPDAVLREPYEAQVHAVGGLRPYDFEVESGELPQGMALQNGTLRGTPTATGTFTFTVAVSDANLNKTVQEYRLNVTEVPPPTFTLGTPQTEVREAVTLRARIGDAREVEAVRALVRWDPAAFRLAGGPTVAGRDVAYFVRDGEGELQVDLAALGNTIDGERELFSFTLEPLNAPALLQVEHLVEVVSVSADPERRHHFLRGSEGRSGAPTQPPATGSDDDGPPGDVDEQEGADDGADDGDVPGTPGAPDDEEPGAPPPADPEEPSDPGNEDAG